MNKIYDILEFNKIRKALSDFANTDSGKEKCLNLSMLKDKSQIEKSIKETDSAFFYLKNGSMPIFNGYHNINDQMLRLKKDASLNQKELLNIGNLLRTTERLIEYRKSKTTNSILDEYFDKLTSLKYEMNEIFRVIISEDEIADNASQILLAIRRKKLLLKEKVHHTANTLLNKYHDYLQDQVVANKDGTLCLPVKSEYKNKIDGTIHSISDSQFTVFIEPKEIIGLNNEIAENVALEQVEINKILFNLTSLLSPHTEILETNYVNLSILDFIFAKAKYAMSLGATLPIINYDGIIDLYKARHPLIDRSVMVPLDIKLGDDFTELIITGPNTGGKTISLKTCGIIEMMALSGLFIPCLDNSKVAYFDDIYADIGDEQSIEQSLSTFSGHMKNIVNILNSATKNSLVLFDEICTGTDPVEGATLAISILDELLNRKTRVMATTHYPELKKYALSKPQVKNGAFEFNVETLKPTYKLLLGIPGKSNAFAISEKLGLNKNIIERAKSSLNSSDLRFEDLISTLHENRLTIEREKKEIDDNRNEIKELKDKIKRQEKGLNDRADSIIRQAKEKARDILFDAKAIADETIKNMKNYNADMQSAVKERSRLNKSLSDVSDSLIEKPKGPAQPLSAKKIKIGATVKILSLNAEGIVETLPDKDYNLYCRVGILRTQVNLRDLELISRINVNVDGTKIKKITSSNGSTKIKLEKSYEVSPSINLIGKTSDEAMLLLDKYIDDCSIAHIPVVRIIHGRGAGVLKKAVNEYCRKSTTIKEYRLGDFTEGGDGVTVATL